MYACACLATYNIRTRTYIHNTSTSLSERIRFMIVSRSANTVALECLLVGCGRYSVFKKGNIGRDLGQI